jgi:predicted lysophospholipase L1 biosynthesis ABC-type transport system permease subunit
VIVNETAARVFWGGEAVGKRVRPQGSPNAWREVVGVVADVKVRSLQEAPTPMMFFSTGQVAIGCCTIVARTEGDPEALLPGLRGALQEAGGNLPVVTLSTMDDYLGVSVSGPRLAAALVSVFSLLALMLASLGIYAAVSFTVARRSSELGIRVALGAARSGVIGLVLRGSLITVGVGLVVGFALALLAAPRLEGILFEVGSFDLVAFLGSASVLLLGAVAASLPPALRAARGDPVEVLRAR